MALDENGNVIDGELPGGNGETGDGGDNDGDEKPPVDPPPVDPVDPVDPDNPDGPKEPDDTEDPEEPEEPEPEPEPEPTYIYQTINNFYNRVRGALGVGDSITDDMIDLYENAPYAELQIVKRVPNFCCLSDIKYALFETCIVYMTCYSLCPSSDRMRVKRQKDPSLELEFFDSSANHDCNRFLELVDDIITTQINEQERSMFVGFKVTKASPSRPNALGENVGCCRHWYPPLYNELIKVPGQDGSGGENGEGNGTGNTCPCLPGDDTTPPDDENVKSKDIDNIVVMDREEYENLENKDERTQYLLRG